MDQLVLNMIKISSSGTHEIGLEGRLKGLSKYFIEVQNEPGFCWNPFGEVEAYSASEAILRGWIKVVETDPSRPVGVVCVRAKRVEKTYQIEKSELHN